MQISFGIMIYTVSIAIYLFALVGVGVYKTKMVKNSEDFMVAGRILPWYILVGTLLATWMGSGSLFSGAGLGYRNGPAALWSSGGAWLGIALIYFIAIAYSIASPKPMLGGKQNTIFLPIFVIWYLFSYFKKFKIGLFFLFNIFHNSVFLLK